MPRTADIVTIEHPTWGPITCERTEEVTKRAGLPTAVWVASCDAESFAHARGATAEEAAEHLIEALED